MDFENDLFELIKALSKAEIKYVVCGGVACVLHGVERATYVLDISVDFGKPNLDKIINLAKNFGLSPRIPEPVEKLYQKENRDRWVADNNALVYTFVDERSPQQLNIFLSYPMNFDVLMKNSETIYVDYVEVNVSSVKDLIYAKESIKPARDKDLIDIKELKRLNGKPVNPVTGKEIDPMFDGHIEKPLSSMTPREKIDYLWLQMMFKWKIRNRVKKVLSHENDNQERSFS